LPSVYASLCNSYNLHAPAPPELPPPELAPPERPPESELNGASLEAKVFCKPAEAVEANAVALFMSGPMLLVAP